MIKIAIVDDDEGIRKNLRELINSSEEFLCEYDFPTAELAISTLKPGLVEIVLMDINLPYQNGIVCTALLKEKYPSF
jgi:DNA-binding NarL/FixJ family response regulator